MATQPQRRQKGYVPLSKVVVGVPVNADHCSCGELKDRRASRCRSCYRRIPDMKVCTGCRIDLPLAAYHRRHTGRPLPKCKSCTAADGRARDPTVRRRYDQASRSRPGHYKTVAARITRRRAEDVLFRLAERVRASIRQAMKRGRKRKDSPTTKMIGCTIEAFRAHIEAQWRPGMSWSNYGPRRDCWQLDHIRPVASFDLSDPEQLRACFHFSNYQPLWTPENASKRDHWHSQRSIMFRRH